MENSRSTNVQSEIKKYYDQLGELLRSFFISPDKLVSYKHKLLEISKELMHSGIRKGMFQFVFGMIGAIFAFMLKASSDLVEQSYVVAGLAFYVLFRLEPVLQDFATRWQIDLETKFDLVMDNDLMCGGTILGVVTQKVTKWYEEQKLHKIMSNEELFNALKSYMKTYWLLKLSYPFDLLKGVLAIVMAFLAILQNDVIPQWIFIPMILVISLISFCTTAFKCMYRNEYEKERKIIRNETSKINNDLMRVPMMAPKDLEMRLGRMRKAAQESNMSAFRFRQKRNIANVILSISDAFLKLMIIAYYVHHKGIANFTLADITSMSAMLVIIQAAMSRIRDVPRVMEDRYELCAMLKADQEDIVLIMNAYEHIISLQKNEKMVSEVIVPPFDEFVCRQAMSQNDKQITLVSKNELSFHQGDIAILYGSSGSGKSTFLKVLTDRIALEENVDIPSTCRALIYDETMRLGSLSLYDELFCCEDNPNREKMEYILKKLHLWQEIQMNCQDVWKWFQEKYFNHSISNGQKQRIILAKLLYHMDDTIDILALDECTSGLDDSVNGLEGAKADDILKFIVEYANYDKKRIIFIATHQNVEDFVSEERKKHLLKELFFVKKGEKSYIECSK